jgi:phospholipase/carboxylesterase
MRLMSLEIRTEDAVAAAPIESLEGRRLLLLLHGLGAHERDLTPLAPALGDDPVIALRAPLPWGPGFAWAPVAMEEAGRGIGLGPAADAVLAWLDALPALGLGRPAAVRLLGFSQGGAVALTMLRRAPERFERLVVLSGFVPDEAEPRDDELAARQVPVLWGRGDADPVIPADAVARTATWLAGHADATVRVYPGLGHGVGEEELRDVARFLAG